jgi:hypothetical protein
MGLCVAHGAGAQTPKASVCGIIYLLKAAANVLLDTRFQSWQ